MMTYQLHGYMDGWGIVKEELEKMWSILIKYPSIRLEKNTTISEQLNWTMLFHFH
jgi:hypothetical protein